MHSTAPSPTQLSQLRTKYEALFWHEKSIVQLLSIIYVPTSRTTLSNCLQKCNIRDEKGRSLIPALLYPILDRLKKAGLVEEPPRIGGIRCNSLFIHEAILKAERDDVLASMSAAVLTVISPSGGSYFYYRSYEECLRDIRMFIYLREPVKAQERVQVCARQYSWEMKRRPPFVVICNNPFDSEWAATLPEPLLIPILNDILGHSFLNLAPADAPFALLSAICGKTARASLPPRLRFSYALELILRGRIGEARALAELGNSPYDLVLLGWSDFLHGGNEDAISRYEAALQHIKKETGKRKVFFHDISGFFYLLALIACGDPAKLHLAGEYAYWVAGREEYGFGFVYWLIQQIVLLRKGDKQAADSIAQYVKSLDADPLTNLFRVLALHWTGSEKANTFASELQKSARKAEKAGYLWLAHEMELLCSVCGAPSAKAPEIEELYRENELIPLCRLIEKTDSWENALKALIMLGKDEQPAVKSAPKARLIWLFSYAGDYLDIQPREQKLNASGKWSSGRNVALKRLKEEASSLDFLLPQDVKICGCIRQEREYGRYYGREIYRLDQDSALPHFIGHPHAFLDGDDFVRLELVKGEPELLVTKSGDDLHISMISSPDAEQKVCLVQESPTRLRVIEVTDDHRRIAGIIGEGLKVPAKARDRALEAIASVSSFLTVHSDIGGGGESLETVSADSTPCIHLLPFNEGLKVGILVRPFSGGGPYFRPGAGGETVIAELDGIRMQTRRDLKGEIERASRAVVMVPVLAEAEENPGEWLLEEPEECLELLLQIQELGDSVKIEWPEGEKFRVRRQASFSQFRASIRQTKDWFELEGELKLDENMTLDMQRLLALLDNGSSRFIRLGDGEFMALTAEFRKRLEDVRAFTDPHGKGVRFHPLAALALEDFTSEVGQLKADKKWKDHVARLRDAQDFKPVLPATLQAEFREYQAEGFGWLNRLSRWGVGACLADDMGLGKTVQALAHILTMAAKGPSLVVAPTSVCMNWESEARRFAPTLNVIIFGGAARKKTVEELRPFDLLVCSYGLMQQEAELMAGVEWQVIVLDEAQAIKNMATKRSQAAMELNGAFKMVTTGTPIENHLGELWNIFRFINPGLLGSLKQFNEKFAMPIEKNQDKKARARLKKLIQPFILRRTKSQVLEELPPRTEIVLSLEMSAEEAAFYEALRRKAVEKLAKAEGNEGQKHLQILAEIMRLRRACCNARLVMPGSGVESSKLAAFAEIVDELRENRHKALVFSQFVDHLAIIREYLDKQGIVYQYLDGSTIPQERKKRVDAFQSGEGELFLISLKAGGVGLNLTAADYVIHMDPWWNPAVEDQASDRAHRIGQQRPVTIYRLVTRGTIEEKIVALHHEKRGLADSLLEGSDMSGKISAAELLNMLRQGV